MILGHKKQRQFLKKMAEEEKVPHALLFSGEEKLGKKLIAENFAMMLNCVSEKKPCGTCRPCLHIKKGIYPDVYNISPSSEIKISEIRELSRVFSLGSGMGRFKIGIIDKAHLMKKDSQNCFLKMLEEPKGKTIFILITEYPEFLLKTILSRVEKIKFFPVRKEEMEKYLVENNISIDYLTEGRPGLMFDLIKNPKKEIDIKEILSSNILSRMEYVKKIVEKEKGEEIIDLWINCFRKEIALSFNSFSKLRTIKDNIELLSSAKRLIMTTNVNKKLLFESLLINLNYV